jgi:hypothetical protein
MTRRPRRGPATLTGSSRGPSSTASSGPARPARTCKWRRPSPTTRPPCGRRTATRIARSAGPPAPRGPRSPPKIASAARPDDAAMSAAARPRSAPAPTATRTERASAPPRATRRPAPPLQGAARGHRRSPGATPGRTRGRGFVASPTQRAAQTLALHPRRFSCVRIDGVPRRPAALPTRPRRRPSARPACRRRLARRTCPHGHLRHSAPTARTHVVGQPGAEGIDRHHRPQARRGPTQAPPRVPADPHRCRPAPRPRRDPRHPPRRHRCRRRRHRAHHRRSPLPARRGAAAERRIITCGAARCAAVSSAR